MMNTKNIVLGVVALGIIGFAALQFGTGSSQNGADKQVNEMSPTVVESQVDVSESSTFKDGEYTATGSYVSPAGPESVEVTVKIENGVVTDAEFVGNAVNPRSIQKQGKFKEGYKASVVGKDIASLELGVTNGSSLTPQGFNDALDQIRDQAQS